MIRSINARLLHILKNSSASNCYLNSRTLVTTTNFHNITVKQFPLCRNYCIASCDRNNDHIENIFKNINFEEITNGDPNLIKELKMLMLQIENFRSEGNLLVPKKITVSDWKHLLQDLTSFSSRKKYLIFLAKNEFKEEAKLRKKQRIKDENLKKLEALNLPDHIKYRLGHNAMFMRINWFSIATLLNCKVLTALSHSNNIVFDLNYEKYMSPREMKDCAKQILSSCIVNRDHINPLNLHLCNTPTEGKMKDIIEKFFCGYKVYETIHVHEESYLEIFDHNSLVYLSPHADKELHEYNPDDVYIIGAYVDKSISLPVSSGKAKAEKIRSARLPLDVYFKWKQGDKSLPLNNILSIMLDLNYYRNMKMALCNHVPPRLYYRDFENSGLVSNRKSEKSVKYSERKKIIQPYFDEQLVDDFEVGEFCLEK